MSSTQRNIQSERLAQGRGRSKVQDESEIKRWFEEGRTYAWMVDEYARKYNLEVVPSMFGNLRRRRGWDRRIARDDDLIPWAVAKQHRWMHMPAMLRTEARLRAGMDVPDERARQLESFKRELEEDDAVVHYDPDTEQGWFLVPRRPGVDDDMIRHPKQKTTLRRRAD